MTTTDAPSKFRYEGNGSTDTFAFTGRVFAAEDLVVEIILRADDTLVDTLTLTTDYSVTINGPSSASVTVTAPNIPSASQDIQIRRALDKTQSLVLPTGTVFPAKAVETALDKATALIQEMQEEIDRSVKLSPTSSINEITFAESPQDGKAMVYSTADGGFINGPDADEIAAAQENAENAATASAAAIAAQAAAEAAAVGMKWRPSVRVATTANLATLEGALTVDGVLLVPDVDRVLVKDQSSPAQNGVYLVRFSTWSRASDADTWDELVSQCVAVSEGSTWADYTFICTSNAGGTLGVSAVNWSTFKIVLQDGAVSTAAKITDGIITYAKMAAAAFADVAAIVAGTASKLIDAATFKTYAETYLPRKVYSSGTISGSPATVSSGAIFRSGYNYLIKWSDIGPATDGQALTMRFLASGSPLTGANYGQNGNSIADNLGTYNSTVAAGATSLLCSGASLGNLTAETSSGEILLFEPNTAKSGYVSATINARGVNTSGVPVGLLGCMGYLVAGQLVDGVQFYFPSGNFANKGKFVIEEIAAS